MFIGPSRNRRKGLRQRPSGQFDQFGIKTADGGCSLMIVGVGAEHDL